MSGNSVMGFRLFIKVSLTPNPLFKFNVSHQNLHFRIVDDLCVTFWGNVTNS